MSESQSVTLAIKRLLKAAKTGTFTDRKAATDQVEKVLGRGTRWENLSALLSYSNRSTTTPTNASATLRVPSTARAAN